MGKMVTVGIADLNIAAPPDMLATFALGSCVGICLMDKDVHIGGLVHIMLPDSSESTKGSAVNLRRYADTGIDELVKLMIRKGARASCLTAKIAGGAQMFQNSLSAFNIGERNVIAVKQKLRQMSIRIIAEDTGSNYGRTVFFDISTGVMQIKSATNTVKNW